MSFTYVLADLADVPLYQVRFLLDDTEETNHKWEDEEILWIITQESDPWTAGAMLADQLSAKFTGMAQSKSIGEMSLSYANLADEYSALARRLRSNRRFMAAPIGYGWRKSEKLELEHDIDREELISRKGGMDYPGTEGI